MNHEPATWPAHARVFSGPEVWMESAALEQLAAVAALPGCVAAAGMPDLHPGRGYPIGAAVASRIVYPHLIGGDAGCGARVAITHLARVSADWVERRIQSMWDTPLSDPPSSPQLFEAVWFHGVRGLAAVDTLPDALRAMAARETENDGLPASADPARFSGGFEHALGTIGGGNHFAEVSRISEIVDPCSSSSLHLTRNSLAVLVHSGSRGLGTALGKAWGQSAVDAHSLPTYLGELAGACRFARANRFILTYRLLSALGALRESALGGTFDVTHNDVRAELVGSEAAWVHRKGAAPAYADAFTVVLGSRGAPSWIMQGTGNPSALQSVAHGAGRKMARGEAREKLRARYKRSEITPSACGGRLICQDQDLLFEEHPDAYKPIEPVIEALEAHGMAKRVAALTPVVTVKL